jgi:hypothetical protein
MTDDPIVDEVRQAREAYAAQFDFDLTAIFADLRRRTEEAARTGAHVVVQPPPAGPVPGNAADVASRRAAG